MLFIVPALLFAAQGGQQRYTPAVIVGHLERHVGRSLGPPGGEVRSLALAPSEPTRLYLGTATGHLYVSRDGGRGWHVLSIRLGHETVVDNLLVHPGNADIVYAAYWAPGGGGGLMRTRDGGATWAELAVPGNPSLRAVAAAPSRATTMYVGGIGGVWRSDDGGDTWRNVNGSGLATDFVESLAVDPRDPDHVYAGTWRQVYRSRDGGLTWKRIYQGMAVDRDIFSLAIDPHDPDTLLAGTCNFLYRSNNRGGSWDELRSGLASDHNRVHTIVHDRRDPAVVYAGTRGALYRSADSGATWRVLVGAVSVSALALSPDGATVYIGTEERGVMVGSPDGGFVESNLGITNARVVAFDALPGAPRVLFAARADGPLRSTIYYSTDIGQRWRPLGVTPSLGRIQFLRAQAAPVNRVIVVGELGWWSASPGGKWVPISAPPGQLAALEIAHHAQGQVLAATSAGLFLARARDLTDRNGESSPFEGEDRPTWQPLWQGGALSALTVGGGDLLALSKTSILRGSVEDLAGSEPIMVSPVSGLEEPPRGVALHPTDAAIAYAITMHDVYRSADGGRHWQKLPLPWPAADLRSVAVDPANPDQILALDYRGAVYRGHGDGQHWLVLDEDPGLYRAWSLRVSAQAPGFALVATQGHGLRVIRLGRRARASDGAAAR